MTRPCRRVNLGASTSPTIISTWILVSSVLIILYSPWMEVHWSELPLTPPRSLRQPRFRFDKRRPLFQLSATTSATTVHWRPNRSARLANFASLIPPSRLITAIAKGVSAPTESLRMVPSSKLNLNSSSSSIIVPPRLVAPVVRPRLLLRCRRYNPLPRLQPSPAQQEPRQPQRLVRRRRRLAVQVRLVS